MAGNAQETEQLSSNSEEWLWPPLSSLSSGDPALSRKVSHRTVSGNALLKLVNLAKVANNPPRAEQLSSEGIKGDGVHTRLVLDKQLQEAMTSRRASKHPVSSSSSGCLDHHYLIGEGESAEQPVATCRLREAIAAARPYNYSSDEYSGINYRLPPPCSADGLFTTNQVPSTDYYWI